MNSLDPRVNRLPIIETGETKPKDPLDQWGTFEVFVQPREGKPFQHEGAVHATDSELAFVLAKETFTRRFLCVSLFVAETQNVFVTPYTDNNQSVYDFFNHPPTSQHGDISFEIFHLMKRGKQHVHAGQVFASNYTEAVAKAKYEFQIPTPVYNVWIIRTSDIRFTDEDEKDLWLTLPEKKFRDASDYKAGDKLKSFTEGN